MRILVYLKIQDLGEASQHEASREVADVIFGLGLAYWCGQNAIQLTTDHSWQATKDMFRALKLKVANAEIPSVSFWDGVLGTGNLIPFSKTHNKDMAPERLHYSTPACADRGAHFGHNMSARATNFPVPVALSSLALQP
jgi:hypothetical protein